ncbi:hypothetical protein TCDM_11081 [Trypanosoma cruzi Dm28c]|uniref:Trans-sialidase n=1 Tax=Trypanosoma cruzi Dm28c TaxID=1416333 RepID=V5B5R6_TRYCR|nr:hypothetical protein TCDM_11081 [Trypanosoma cruzi Dm28c]
MRRGRDERRAEGAVTCGRATGACGAEHTFLSLLFLFLLRPGLADTRSATHTQPHPAAVFFFYFCFCFCVNFLRRAWLLMSGRTAFTAAIRLCLLLC